ncbi:MAG: c-type cytochrome [Anaerolineae bacterium]
MADNEAPVRTFAVLYTLASRVGVLVMLVVFLWLLKTLVANSPVGTARTELAAISVATRTALAQAVPTPEGRGLVALPVSCAACHAVAGKGGAVCPDLTHIGRTAEERVESPDYSGSATTAEEYLRESITNPGAFVTPGFDEGIMPPNGGLQAPSDAQIQLVVDFLLEQE